MHFNKSLILVIFSFLIFISAGKAQNTLIVDVASVSNNYCNYEIKIDVNVSTQIDFYKITGFLNFELNPDILASQIVTIDGPQIICVPGNTPKDTRVYSVSYSILQNQLVVTLLRFPSGTNFPCGGVISLIPAGGRLINYPSFIQESECSTLAQVSVYNCLGYYNDPGTNIVFQIPVSGSSDVMPGVGSCSYCIPDGGHGQHRINQTNQQFSIYPNPTTNWLTVNNYQFESLLILDAKGALIREITPEFNHPSIKIDVSDLPQGMYLIKSGNQVEKLVKL